ncbi:CsgG/HfaB family protein [Elusimicrobiota bacterium]
MKTHLNNNIFILFLAIAAVTFCGCGPKVAFRPDYNFNKIERIGVLKFDSSQIRTFDNYIDPGNAVADEFVFQFLSRGIRVVERSRLESIIREHNLWKSGNIDPATIREMGKILGVDALIIGTVTKYVPDKKNRVYIKDDKGKLQEEIFLVDAEIGISARMVDVVTGEIIWASSYKYDSFYISSAIRQAVSAILDSLKKAWLFDS